MGSFWKYKLKKFNLSWISPITINYKLLTTKGGEIMKIVIVGLGVIGGGYAMALKDAG